MPDLIVPGPFGPYDLIALLGQGSYGAVYRARPRAAGLRDAGEVALKLFKPPGVDEDPAWYMNRLKAEVAALRALKHDNIVGFRHAAVEDGQLYIEMELVDGPSLGQLLRDRAGPLPPAAVVQLALQLCAGLEVAHDPDDGHPVIHRDFKPDNVLLSRQGVAKISDFGLAKVATGGAASMSLVVGTACYIAPEQLEEGGSVDARADLFALGIVLAEAALGEGLFPRDKVDAMYVIRRRLEPYLAEQDVPARVDGTAPGMGAIVGRLLARDPADRFPDAAAVEAAIVEGVAPGLLTKRRALRGVVREWLAEHRGEEPAGTNPPSSADSLGPSVPDGGDGAAPPAATEPLPGGVPDPPAGAPGPPAESTPPVRTERLAGRGTAAGATALPPVPAELVRPDSKEAQLARPPHPADAWPRPVKILLIVLGVLGQLVALAIILEPILN